MDQLLAMLRVQLPGIDDVKLSTIVYIVAGALQRAALPEKPGPTVNGTRQHHVKSDGQQDIKFGVPTTPNSDVSYLDLDLISGSGSHPDLSKQIREDAIRDEPAGFIEFWGLYPKRVGKAEARRAWIRKRPPITKVRATLAWQRRSQQWRDGYVPNPATWINQGRWEDEPADKPPPPPAASPAAQPWKGFEWDKKPRPAWPEKETNNGRQPEQNHSDRKSGQER